MRTRVQGGRAGTARSRAGLLGAILPLISVAAFSACREAAAPSRLAAATPAPSSRGTAAIPDQYGLRPAERGAVQDFLRRHSELRSPTDQDRRLSPSGEGDIRHLYGVYHPYFVRGDLNDDGVLDFVMAFVRRGSGPPPSWFTVVVFSGKDSGAGAAGSFGPETFLERDITLASGDVSIDRDAVLITPDLEDETTRRYRWDPARRSYVFVRDDETEAEPPDLSRT